MTTTPTPTETQALTAEADQFVAALHNVADFLASHPRIANEVAVANLDVRLYAWALSADEFGEFCRHLGAATKADSDAAVFMVRTFGPISVRAAAAKSATCERVVIGTRQVEREVYPDDVKPTVELVDEEIVEWICPDSFLALGAEVSA